MDPFSSVAGLLGMTQGDKSSATVTPISSGVSGATSFGSGGLTVNNSSNSMTMLVIAGIAALALVVIMRVK